MKKILTLLCLIGAVSANGQTIYFSEDFQAGTTLPAGWVQQNQAGDVSGWQIGLGSVLGSNLFPVPAITNALVTNDDKDSTLDKSNSNIITPLINLTSATGVILLQFEQYFLNDSYAGKKESAYISYSTNGGTTYTFLDSIRRNKYNIMEARAIDIASLAGQANVKFKFSYSDGTGWLYGLALDNIKVIKPLARDGFLMGMTLSTRFTKANNSLNIPINIQNLGSASITSISIATQVDNLAPVNNNVTPSTPIVYLDFQTVSVPISVPAGNHTVRTWISGINGSTDLNPINDSSKVSPLIGCTNETNREVLIEEFTSSTCPPCASLNVNLDPWIISNNINEVSTDVNMVKYQMNWPSPGTDPSYNPDGNTRKTYYAVNGIPSVTVDGLAVSSSVTSISDAVNERKALKSFMKIEGKFLATGLIANITTDVTPLLTWSNSSTGAIKLHIAVVEKFYTFAGNTTGQTDYHFVQRKMFPNGSGRTITSFVDGTKQSFTDNYTFTNAVFPTLPLKNSFTLWTSLGDSKAVIFVQDELTDEVLQSLVLDPTFPSGIEDINNNTSYIVYPNPANNVVNIGLQSKITNNVEVSITDATGKLISTSPKQNVNAGKNVISIDLSNQASGLYFVNLIVDGQILTKSFTKN